MDFDVFLRTVRGSALQTRFFHFTDKKNLDLIRANGLLSTAELRRRNMLGNVKTGGDANSLQSDHNTGTDQYVCLCFTTSHPMCYVAQTDERKLDPVWLGIDPEIIKADGVMLTNAPSNQGGVEKVPAAQALDALDLHVIYNRTDWGVPEIYARRVVSEKYEILIPKSVAKKYIVSGL
jgi:hypothetical protein